MPKLICTVLLLCLMATSYCQTTKTRYFNNKYLEKETTQDKAKFSETVIKNPDGSVTIEVKNIKRDQLISTESYKGNELVGIWMYKGRNIPEPLDYSFDLVYSDQHCTDTIAGVVDYFSDNPGLGYIAPKIATGEKELSIFIAKKLRYPSPAVQNNIQGRLRLYFTITSDGKIENLGLKKGIHPILDKEAIRVLRNVKFSSPPMLNGQPITICSTTPMSFKLE